MPLDANHLSPGRIAASVLQDLVPLERDQEKQSNVACDETVAEKTSPWLQLTRWLYTSTENASSTSLLSLGNHISTQGLHCFLFVASLSV